MAEKRKFARKYCRYTEAKIEYIDYKDTQLLKYCLSERFKIMPRRLTGTSKKVSRDVRTSNQTCSSRSVDTICNQWRWSCCKSVWEFIISNFKLKTFCFKLKYFISCCFHLNFTQNVKNIGSIDDLLFRLLYKFSWYFKPNDDV